MRYASSPLALLACVGSFSALLSGQGIRQERVNFKPGASSALIEGRLKGAETVDHVLRAREGQNMRVGLKATNGATYFNVLPPGSDVAIANSSTSGNQWTGALPADGDYRIRVYLMRSAARRDETSAYTLTVAITGSADAKVAGTPYHATGKVPCSVGADAKGSAQCSFGVIRSGPGKAEVHLASPGFDVTLHKDRLRTLRFDGSNVVSANPKEKVKATKQNDAWSVDVNGFEFYTIPDAVISGG